ncbi:MAG: protein translocase subunit SecD [Neisseriaceae bacterium]|nr:protein translocase subunit SecD [Neisseriaceae bacterium]
MNRYPLWKYILVVITILVACLYTIPNFFGETPAVQVSTNRQSLNVAALQQPISQALQSNGISHNGMFVADGSLKVRFSDEETQLKARDIIEKTAGDGYITALNLIPDSPAWLAKIRANPMFLGLDLRGGVHFLMQVDMEAALQKKLDSFSGDIRRALRNEKIRNSGVSQNGNALSVNFQDAQTASRAMGVLQKALFDAQIAQVGEKTLSISIPDNALQQIREEAVKQNINTLHNRVNELGVAEPVIQQAGSDRIVVQLPGIQDTARAKDIIGRTATLELHMVADDALLQQALAGVVPTGYELLYEAGENPVPVLVSTQVELTGDSINAAQQDFDENGAPAVALRLNNQGAAIFGDLTRANVGKRMAMVLIDQGKKEVVTAPVIRQAITGGRVQISGAMNVAQAIDTALLLRSGSLAAPMEIIEERTIGPSLGRENIQKGFRSTLWGFVAVAVFMIIYYRMFGLFSVIALTSNLLFLIAILSALQATLTLPGIAAIALTLGMAIDANVLINERIREELRDGQPPQMAINKGYEFAWGTIVDSNITSLIAGLALLIFGSGPVRGFAVVHCIGILTSMYSAVVVSRSLANLWYGSRRKLKSISIGTVYKPKAE